MKKYIIISALAIIALVGCTNLDLNPLTEGSSENWFSNQTEVEMALNELYGQDYWYYDTRRFYHSDRYTDDWNQREYVYDYLKGEISSTWPDARTCYRQYFKVVSRANTILSKLSNAKDVLTEGQMNQYRGEACFFRAVGYSYLTFLYGDVPFYTEYVSLDDAYKMSRTDKATVLEQVYKDFDEAIKYLPDSYSGVKRITKGMAYAFKARTALWNSDWEKCLEAARGCINTGEFELESDFSTIFKPETKSCKEWIFYIPRSESLGSVSPSTRSFIPRIAGGTATAQPSLELFCTFLCTDGKTIDKSPLFDPLDPFKNRDPRLAKTIVPFGTKLEGYTIDPRPWVKKVENAEGQEVKNKENRTIDQYASYNGMYLAKGVSPDWFTNYNHEGYIIVMRYAEVLLMLAEAKCELGQIDDEALKAFNQVRARAYGVDYTKTSRYPALSTTSQSEFRTAIRIERRMEFAWENHRFFDLIRWRTADKALNKPMVGLSIEKLKTADESNWFMSSETIPVVDEDGVVDLKPILNKNCFVQIAFGTFDPSKQYLYPIPANEILICPNITQNEGY